MRTATGGAEREAAEVDGFRAGGAGGVGDRGVAANGGCDEAEDEQRRKDDREMMDLCLHSESGEEEVDVERVRDIGLYFRGK